MNEPESGAGNLNVGRAMAANCDPRYPGAVFFALGTHDLKGNPVQVRAARTWHLVGWRPVPRVPQRQSNHQVELGSKPLDRIFTAEECTSNNSSKSTPCLSADIFGDCARN